MPKTHREKLIERMVDLFRSGLFVQLSCHPSAAVNDQKVQVRAVFYSPRDLGSGLKPVLRCEEAPSFALRLEEEPSSSRSKRQFRGEFEVSKTGMSEGTLSLLLHPDSSSKPVAQSEIHVFTGTELSKIDLDLT
jgi:hypothetical protein